MRFRCGGPPQESVTLYEVEKDEKKRGKSGGDVSGLATVTATSTTGARLETLPVYGDC